jgi:F-type H+-transporting ATPase subunit b
MESGVFTFYQNLLFWEIVCFLVLLFLLIRYVFPPIRKTIDERQKAIEGAIDEAEKTRAEARELLADYRRQLDEARGEARQILDESRKQGEAQRERTRREAREEGERIIARAREEIDRERLSALREIRAEVADMVIGTSERVIGRSLGRDEHERLIYEAMDSLESEVAAPSGRAAATRDGRG